MLTSLLPTLPSRRLPEIVGIDGWVAQSALALRLDLLQARLARSAPPQPALARAAEVFSAASGQRVDPRRGAHLAHLIAGGLVESRTFEERDALLAATLAAASVNDEPVHLAWPSTAGGEANIERVCASAGLEGRWELVGPQTTKVPRAPVLVGTPEALALLAMHGGDQERASFSRTRLIAADADGPYLSQGLRRVLLQAVVDRPELLRRVHDAVTVASALDTPVHYQCTAQGVVLTDAGRAHIGAVVPSLDRWWAGPNRREELICLTLSARELLSEGQHYGFDDGRVVVDAARLPGQLPQRAGDIDLALVLQRWHRLSPPPMRVNARETTLLEAARRYGAICGTVRPASRAVGAARRLLGLGIADATRGLALRLGHEIFDSRAQMVSWVCANAGGRAVIVDHEDDRVVFEGQDAAQSVRLTTSRALLQGELPPGSVLWVAGPSAAGERRILRAMLSHRGYDTQDVLSREHRVVEQHLEVEQRLPSARALHRAMRRQERLESASRLVLFRNSITGKDRYAFIGEDRGIA
ncbi:MAG: hypothetical protein AAF184_18785 [Pseudomonadota bacterium]